MPHEALGDFLDSTTGLWVLIGILAVLLAAVRFALRRTSFSAFRGRITTLAALFYLAAVSFGFSLTFPVRGEVSAAVVPRLWVAGLVVCCLYLLINTIRGREAPDPVSGSLSLVYRFIGITIAYLVLIQILGFFLSSFIFLVTGMLVLGYRRKMVIFAVAAGWMTFTYVIFYRILFVPLPDGLLVRILAG